MEKSLSYYADCCVFLTNLPSLDPESIESQASLMEQLPRTLLNHISPTTVLQISDATKDCQKESGLSDDAVPLVTKFSLRSQAYKTVIALCKAARSEGLHVSVNNCAAELFDSNFPVQLIDSVVALASGQSAPFNPTILAKPSPTQLLAAHLVTEDLKHAATVLYYLTGLRRQSKQFVAACSRLVRLIEGIIAQMHNCIYSFPVVLQKIASNLTIATHVSSLVYVSAFVNCTEFPSEETASLSRASLFVSDLVSLTSTAVTDNTARMAFFWLYCALSSFQSTYPSESLVEVVQTTFNELCVHELEPALRTRKESIKAGSLSRTHYAMEPERQTAFGQITSDASQLLQRHAGSKSYQSVIPFEEKLSIVRTYLSRNLIADSVRSALLDSTSTKPLLHLAELPAPAFDVLIEFARICYHVRHMNDPNSRGANLPINPSNEGEYKNFLLDKLSPVVFTEVVLRLAIAGLSLYMESNRALRFVAPATFSLGEVSESLCTNSHDDFIEALPLLYNTLGSLFGTTFSWMDPLVKECRLREANTYYGVINMLMDKCLEYERSELDALQSAHAQRRSIANLGISRYDRHNMATATGQRDGTLAANTHGHGNLGATFGLANVPDLNLYCSRLMACVGCMLAVGGDSAFRGLNSDGIVTVILEWLFSELDTPSQILGAISIAQGLASCPTHGTECMNGIFKTVGDSTLTKPLADLINLQKSKHLNVYGQEAIRYGGFDVSAVATTISDKIYDAIISYASPFSIYLLSRFIISIGGVETFVRDALVPLADPATSGGPGTAMVRETAFGIQQLNMPTLGSLRSRQRGTPRQVDDLAILTADDIISFAVGSKYAPQALKMPRNQLLRTLCTNLTPLTNMPDFDLVILEQAVRTLALYNINPEVTSQVAFVLLLRVAITLTITVDPMNGHPKYNTLLENKFNLRYLRLLEAALGLLSSANNNESAIFMDHLSSEAFGPELTTTCSVLTEVAFQTGPLYEAGGFETMELANVLHSLEDMIISVLYSSFVGGKNALITLLQTYLSSSLCIRTKARVEYMSRSVYTIAREISMVVLKDVHTASKEYSESHNLLANIRLQTAHGSTLQLFNTILRLFNVCMRPSLSATDDDLIIGISEILILDNFSAVAESMIEILLSDKEFLTTIANFVSNSVIAALHSQHIYTLTDANEPLIQGPPESSEQSVISCLLFVSRLLTLARHPTFLIPNIVHSIGLLVSSRASCPYEGDLPGRYSTKDATGRYADPSRIDVYREQKSVKMGTSSLVLLLFCLLDRFCTSDMHTAARVLLLELRRVLDLEAFAREIEGSCALREMLKRTRHSFMHNPSCAESLLVAISCELPAEADFSPNIAAWVPSVRLLKLFFLGEESRCSTVRKSLLRVDPVTSLYYALQTLLEKDVDHLWLYPGLAEHGYSLLSQFLEYTFVGPQAPQSQDAMHVLSDLGGRFFANLFIKIGFIVKRTRKLQDYVLDENQDSVSADSTHQIMEKTTSVIFATASALRLITIYLHIAFNSSNLVSDSAISELVSGLFGPVLGTICYPTFNEEGLDALIELFPQEDKDALTPPRMPSKFDSLSHEAVQLIAQIAAEAFSVASASREGYLSLYEIIIECMHILSRTPKAELSEVSRQAILPSISNLTGRNLRYNPLVSKTKLCTQLLLMPLTIEQREGVVSDSNIINSHACVMEASATFLHALNNVQYNAYTNMCDAIQAGLLANCGTTLPLSSLMNNYLKSSLLSLNCYVFMKTNYAVNFVPEIINEMLFAIQQAAVFIKRRICSLEAEKVYFLSSFCFDWLKLTIRVLANIPVDDNECSLQHALSATASVMQTIVHIANTAVDREFFVTSFLEQLSTELNVQSYFADALKIALSCIETCSSKMASPEIKDYVGHAALTVIQSTTELLDVVLAFLGEESETSTFFSEFMHRLINETTLTTLFASAVIAGKTLFSSATPLKTTSLITQSVATANKTNRGAGVISDSIGMVGSTALTGANTMTQMSGANPTAQSALTYTSIGSPGEDSSGGVYDISPASTLFLRGLLFLIARLASWYHDPQLIETYIAKFVENGSGWVELLQLLSLSTLRERMPGSVHNIDKIFREFFIEGSCSPAKVYDIAAGNTVVGEVLSAKQYSALLSCLVFRIHLLGYAFLSMVSSLMSVLPKRSKKAALSSTTGKSVLPVHFYTSVLPNIVANVHILSSLKATLGPGVGFSEVSPLPFILSLVLGEIDCSLSIAFFDGTHSDDIIRTACNFICVVSDVVGQTVPSKTELMNKDIIYYPLSMSVFIPAISSAVQCILEYIIYSLSNITSATTGIGTAVSSTLLSVTRDIGGSIIPLLDKVLFALVAFESSDALESNNRLQCIERMEYVLLTLLQPEYQLIVDKAYSSDIVARPNVGYVDIGDVLENILVVLRDLDSDIAKNLAKMVCAILKCQL